MNLLNGFSWKEFIFIKAYHHPTRLIFTFRKRDSNAFSQKPLYGLGMEFHVLAFDLTSYPFQ